jgi:hypothetical protein
MEFTRRCKSVPVTTHGVRRVGGHAGARFGTCSALERAALALRPLPGEYAARMAYLTLRCPSALPPHADQPDGMSEAARSDDRPTVRVLKVLAAVTYST